MVIMKDSKDVMVTATWICCTDALGILESVGNLLFASVVGHCWNEQPDESEIYGKKLSSAVGPGKNSITRPVWATCAHGACSQQPPILINTGMVQLAEQTMKAGEATWDSFIFAEQSDTFHMVQEQFFTSDLFI